MPKNPLQNQKLLRLQQIFLQETDENHGLTMDEIIGRLAACGITAERKSVYENIETLNQCGMDILREKRGNRTYYYAASREFETAELRLLADAVASSRFITAKKSGELLKKLETLTSHHHAAGLRRQVHVPSRIKNMNETIFYLVDELNRAISENASIEFCYYDWVADGQTLTRIPRHGGQRYHVSPWQLLWEDEFYYLIAFDHRTETIRHYRVDRMGNIVLTDQKRMGAEEFKKIRMEDYTARLFGMFAGETQTVTLTFPARLLDVMIDRFGKELRLQKNEKEGFLTLRAPVIPSLPFYGWLVSLGPEVTLDSPEALKQEYIKTLKKEIENNG